MTFTPDLAPSFPLCDRLRKSRQLAGLEQGDIAAILGCSRNTVSNWETGRATPSAVSFVHWAAVTRVSLDWLAAGIPPVESSTPEWVRPSWHELATA